MRLSQLFSAAISLVLLATMAVGCAEPSPTPTPMPTPTPVPTEPEAVTFPDENLEAAIREAIGKPEGPILTSELEELTTLSASERNIANLHGLDFCSKLTELNLRGNPISDISPLASLTNLTLLYLYGNQISDISPLASLTNLTVLSLPLNQISDISPLASLTNLTELNVVGNRIIDISPLASLPRLHRLAISNNPLSPASLDIHIPQLEERGVKVYWPTSTLPEFESDIALIPFTDKTFGIKGIVPEGWVRLSPGMYARSKLGSPVIGQQAIPGMDAEVLLQLVTNQLDLDEIPEASDRREANDFDWSLYEVEVESIKIDFAIAEDNGTSYSILLQSTADERDFYYAELYLPAIDNLTPIVNQ